MRKIFSLLGFFFLFVLLANAQKVINWDFDTSKGSYFQTSIYPITEITDVNLTITVSKNLTIVGNIEFGSTVDNVPIEFDKSKTMIIDAKTGLEFKNSANYFVDLDLYNGSGFSYFMPTAELPPGSYIIKTRIDPKGHEASLGLDLYYYDGHTIINPEVPLPNFSPIAYSYDAGGNRISRVIAMSTKSAIDEEVEKPTPVIEELANRTIKIYPNPTQGYMKVEISDFEKVKFASMSLLSMQGQTILTKKNDLWFYRFGYQLAAQWSIYTLSEH